MFITRFTLIYTALFEEPGRTGTRMASKSSNTGGKHCLNMDFYQPVCMLAEQYEWSLWAIRTHFLQPISEVFQLILMSLHYPSFEDGFRQLTYLHRTH